LKIAFSLVVCFVFVFFSNRLPPMESEEEEEEEEREVV
jgi:hypothetical protein